ncbi:two-component system, sensor histidine kinase YesM [Paenibacillus sp. UNCCL117]|uniref:sensor histidine kinase n=1 Tax=unclassified Paenibacillus TaxID=185978 RepID=UPI00088B0274|nr:MULTISPECIES: histidine kinase [unclassified Paenibacillus]SDC26625.1 two-component system, sensor histidine kinase YesM [Paenibacillus sp. cl123]SFW20140.1 two-component system, sensor histidine kinase YesM [Paenibacillus sp. UNCCL117]
MYHSIRTKFIILLLIATVVPICTSMLISYYYTESSVTEYAIKNTKSKLLLGQMNLTNYMTAVNQSSLSIYAGIGQINSVNSYIENLEPVYSDANDVSGLSPKPPDSLRNYLINLLRAVKGFYKIHLYTVQNKMSTLQYSYSSRHIKNLNYKMPTARKAYIEPPHLSHNYGMENVIWQRENIQVITFHRPIIKEPSSELLGYMSIDIRMDLIKNIGEQLSGQGNDLYIIDQNDSIIYSPNETLWGQKVIEPWVASIRSQEQTSGQLEWKGTQFSGLIFYEKMDTGYMNWTIVKLTPYEELSQTAKLITRINSLLFGVFLAIAVMLTSLITVRLTRSIKKMLGYVREIERGNLQQEIDIPDKNEIGILAKQFQKMMGTINDLILREYKLEIANTTNQLKALQAQTNPHFLYNALQSIASQAIESQDRKTYKLILSLGKMMRYSMNTADSLVELHQEIDYVLAYLKLQKARFEETFDYELKILGISGLVRIPKMIIQPIVENYFKHGYTPRPEMARIVIQTSFDNETGLFEIEVADNGFGMTDTQLDALQDRLAQAMQGLDTSYTATEHIGLGNVLARLRLHYGNSTEMEISHNQPYGLRVKLKFLPEPLDRPGSEAREEQEL